MNLLLILWRYKELIIISLLLASTSYYKHRYDALNDEYDAFKNEIIVQSRLSEQKNELLKAAVKKSLTVQAEQYDSVTKKLNLDRDKLSKDLQREILLNSNRLTAYANRLQIDNSNRIATDNIATNPEEFAETERERDAAIIGTLTKSGAKCALEFNLCRGWVDSVCNGYKCE